MDPAVIVFGLGVGFLIGLTGMGGGSLMAPILVLIFGVKPVTAVGTDVFYGAVTKVVGAWRHLRMGTVNVRLALWLALGSVPAAIAGVALIEHLEDTVGRDFDSIVLALLAAALLAVGVVVLVNSLFFERLMRAREREDFEIESHHRLAAVFAGALTGFVIGVTSAGSGTLVAIVLLVIYQMAPRQVVSTDVFHAAILLTAASVAHLAGGNIDFGLAGNILVGSIPGVWLGSNFSARVDPRPLRLTLGVVIVASAVTLLVKAGGEQVPWAVGAASVLIAALVVWPVIAPRVLSLVVPRYRSEAKARAEAERERTR